MKSSLASRSLPAGLQILGVAAFSAIAVSAAPFTATDRQPTPEELKSIPPVASREKAEALMKEVKVPSTFDFTIFATPPAVNYPVFVAAAPDGTLYVSSDGNGSLDRKPHLGRVLRVRDTNGDGQADEVKAFVPDVDSPRGLVWDHDRLYLLHPPDISVYIDKDGDGVADEEKTLIKGIAFGFKDRPADHSSNGLEIGVDGWIYAAIGDFGFMEAVGTDGRKLQQRGGGVVRFRPDGSNLELFANGTRNILEAAVSPLLDIFARDNTNDGGGWDIRFHHFSGLTEHGYPRLFKNFSDEIITRLADYGGGSGCGAAWIDEPGIPAEWNNAPMTSDWGRDWIYHHGTKPEGATFTVTQEEFIHVPRPTDLDVDGNSAIYAASWKGATFTWVGPEAGFIVKATPKGFKPEPLPDFEKASNNDLVKLLESPSHRRRLEAQRTIIRRGLDARLQDSLEKMAGDKAKSLASRVAAVFALKQGLGVKSTAPLQKLLKDETIAAWAIRAIADRENEEQGATPAMFAASIKSTDARIRKEAAVALSRLGDKSGGASLIPLLGDADPVVAHSAVQTLRRLKASEAAFKVVDDTTATQLARTRAIQVLQVLHEPVVVDALLTRLDREKSPGRREGLITALCRLHFVDGPWKGDSWGTRPDTRGPYYQPEAWQETPKIRAALDNALQHADTQEAAFIGRELARHRIPAGNAIDNLIARAATEPSLLPAIAAQLADAENVPDNAVALLAKVATSDDSKDAARAQAIIALAKTGKAEAWTAALQGLPKVERTQTENNLAERARGAILNASKLDQVHATLEEIAAKTDGKVSQLADRLLLKVAALKIGAPEAREAANKALDAGWAEPKRRMQIMRAAAEGGDASRAAQFVAATADSNAEVAKVAGETIKRLKIDPAKFQAEAKAPHVGDMPVDKVVAAIMTTHGDTSRGAQLFTQVGCVSCHTVKADEPLKGPFLGNIATIYKRHDLAEAILMPNKTIAQGFATHHFELKDGEEMDGFVVREAADAVTIRNVVAQEVRIAVKDIAKREKQERSLMPEGLVAGLSVNEFASLLDYLEALAKGK